MPTAEPWYRNAPGLAVVAVYGLLTLAAALASTGAVLDGAVFAAPAGQAAPGRVPAYVYLYAFLGGMAYAFTSLLAGFERGSVGVLRVGIRAIAALPLAAGVFLLVEALGVGTSGGRLLTDVAFLVWLYVNVALRALGGLADRLFGRSSGDGPSGR